MLQPFGVDALGITKNMSLGLYYGRANYNLQRDANPSSAASFTRLPCLMIDIAPTGPQMSSFEYLEDGESK